MSVASIHVLSAAIRYTALPALLLTSILLVRSIRNAPRRPLQAVVVPSVVALITGLSLRYFLPIAEDIINNGHLPVDDVYVRIAQENSIRFQVADLHCDTLMWTHRDTLRTETHPLFRGRILGTADVPRLIAGRVTLQIFAIVNSVPKYLNFESNPPATTFSDSMVLISTLQGWPVRTWFSPRNRVLFQARRLHTLALRSNGTLKVVLTGRDLSPSQSQVAAVLAVEGLSSLNGELATVDEFFGEGIRILGPVHLFDTDVGGSNTGLEKGGLSEFGRAVMARMKALNMIVDLSHASLALTSDILNLESKERPALFISHTGLKSVCPSSRNLADEHMQRIADVGGLIGITLFEPALCGGDIIRSFVETVSHAAKVLGGVDSIALGSDWDGSITTSVSASDTHLLSSALLKAGNFTEEDVRKIMFENAMGALRRMLPP